MKRGLSIILSISITLTLINLSFPVGNDIKEKSYLTNRSLSPLTFETTVLGTVVERNTAFSTIDTKRYEKKSRTYSTVDYLNNIPNISFGAYPGSEGSVVTPFSRGDKLNIAINGFDISTSVNSSYDLSLIEPLYFKGIEIYYGPSSSRYGSGHYNGIINLETLGDENSSFIRIVRSLNPLLDPNEYYVMSDLSLITEVGKFYLGVGYTKLKNNYTFDINTLYTNKTDLEPTNYVRQGAEYNRYSLLARYIGNWGDLSVESGFLGTLPEVHEPNRVLRNDPLNYEKAISKSRFVLPYLKLSYKYDNIETTFKLHYTEHLRNRNVEKLQNPLWGGSIGSVIYGNKFSSELSGKYSLNLLEDNQFSLGAGLGYTRDGYYVNNTNFNTWPTTSTNETYTNAYRDTLGLYLEANYKYNELVDLLISSRFDYIDFNKVELSPRLGVLIKPTDIFGVRSSVWYGYRLPYFDDVYGPVAYGYGTSPNTNLQTEYVQGIDLGAILNAKLGNFGFFFSLTPFYSYSTNLIGYDPSIFTTRNFSKVINRGVEIIGKLSYEDVLTSLISYTYNEPIDLVATEKLNWEKVIFLPYRPLNSLYVDIVFDDGYYGIGAYMNYSFGRYSYVYNNTFTQVIGMRNLDDIMVLSLSMWARPHEYVELGIEALKYLLGNEYSPGYPVQEEKIYVYVVYTIGL
jgi:outer membrane receptor protein involved in Fe transport